MKKLLLSFFTFFLCCVVSRAEFGIWASAVYLNVNGTAEFYNTQKISGPGSIGRNTLAGTLGIFGKNSGTLKLLGAQIRTFREPGANICGATLYYTIYERNNRPVSPIFMNINLGMYCNCSNGSFSSCGGGPCAAGSDQQWQTVNQSIDLTDMAVGNYTAEIYYQVAGEISGGTCGQKRVDNSSGTNYKVDFAIAAPLAISFSGFTGACTSNSIKLKWTLQNDVDIIKYEVQKSDNGLSFYPSGLIPSNQLATASSYSFSDKSPIAGTNYYRIKLYNSNGTVSLSNALRIYFGSVGNTLYIYPNPSGSELTVRFAAVNKGKYRLSVYSNDGSRILTMPFEHDGIDKTMKINLPVTIAQGVYRLFLIDRTQFYRQSFLIR